MCASRTSASVTELFIVKEMRMKPNALRSPIHHVKVNGLLVKGLMVIVTRPISQYPDTVRKRRR